MYSYLAPKIYILKIFWKFYRPISHLRNWKTKLQKNKIEQKQVAKIDLLPANCIFGIGLLPFEF